MHIRTNNLLGVGLIGAGFSFLVLMVSLAYFHFMPSSSWAGGLIEVSISGLIVAAGLAIAGFINEYGHRWRF